MRYVSKFYCPVDEKETNLKLDGTCEQCDSDLTPLLRLKALPKGYLEEALKLKEAGHINRAIEKLIIAANVTEDPVEAILELANLYAQKGLFDDALFQYDRALAIQPSNAEIQKARENAAELKSRFIQKNNESTRRLHLFKKLVITTPFAAFLIGLSIIPISTHFKQPSSLHSLPSTVQLSTHFKQPSSLHSLPSTVQQQANISAFKYTVKASDCLVLIAYRFYGDSQMWRKIYEANKDKIRNPDKLSVGQIIAVPIEPK